MAMTRTTLLCIRKTLEQCADCPGFYGAVLASPEGLVLAAAGQFDGDESAACASGLMVNTSVNLGQMAVGSPLEIMIWGDDGKIWNVSALTGGYIMLIASTEAAHLNRLRQIMHRATTVLNQALRILV